jgi:penicillin G amidase
VALSGNWIVADHLGNIALQQTGIRPARPHAPSLLPQLGWRPNVSWTGVAPASELFFEMNPARGFLATANNQHVEHAHRLHTINIDIGDYRVARISSQLARLSQAKDKISPTDMQALQADTFSLQAERYMAVLRPVVRAMKNCHKCTQLAGWDCRYDGKSRGALLFTLFYNELVAQVMNPLVGADAWAQVRAGGSVFYCIMQRLDNLVLADGPSLRRLTANVSLVELVTQIAERVLLPGMSSAQAQLYDVSGSATYGNYLSLTFTNIFYQGRLGALGTFFGIDHGPHAQSGSHATVVQGGQGVNFGMLVNIGPVWRFVADLRESGAWSVLAGGASGRPGSPWYSAEVDLFLNNKYKYLP